MSTNANGTGEQPRRKVVVAPVVDHGGDRGQKIVWAMLAALISLVTHAGLIFLIMQIDIGSGNATPTGEIRTEQQTKVEDENTKETEPDLTQVDIGIDPMKDTNYNLDRIEEVSVPGQVNPTEAVGIPGAPEGNPRTVPAPPGTGGGTGGAPAFGEPGTGQMFGDLGGMGGLASIGAFGGRSGATRQKMVAEGGGNNISEACVASGLEWLALHQAQDGPNEGHWSLHNFNGYARTKPLPAGQVVRCDCEPGTSRQNDIAATAFALLPYLAAGQTHRPNKGSSADYSKSVGAALNWMMRKQAQNGSYSSEMYSHGLATIAMCEAYGMTSDPMLKMSAQRAIHYIEMSQDPAGGGWRYAPRTPGDLSVTGWQLMALKSGQMAGLSVNRQVLQKAERFLDACQSSDGSNIPGGGYKYMPNTGVTATMTAVGMLCRQYSGVNPRNPGLLKGVEILKKAPPGTTHNYYYEYYATQVMHHMGGEAWNFWNLGPDGKNGIRDTRIRAMDTGNRKAHQKGSWAPPSGGHANDGGRIMATGLSLLMLEVYYRHLPLYRRDVGVVKEAKE
jgi:hypothetical protein